MGIGKAPVESAKPLICIGMALMRIGATLMEIGEAPVEIGEMTTGIAVTRPIPSVAPTSA